MFYSSAFKNYRKTTRAGICEAKIFSLNEGMKIEFFETVDGDLGSVTYLAFSYFVYIMFEMNENLLL